ncbi:tRNA pseudouridine(38-40) synthase TruA [bacterium DOLZORAL124_64_63]|nr:MAG: tRNA pseudouridine(38-40) synthase TruA [bacterium DOLZORAL124_64_63]
MSGPRALEPVSGVRVRMTVAYVGAGFFGWQIQPDRRTVQGELKRALGRLMGREVSVVGAGRTDTGVNARGQVAHVTVANAEEAARIPRALPGMLPADMTVTDVRAVPVDFNARFSAVARRYSYHLYLGRDIFRSLCWQIAKPLDRAAMDAAAVHFRGSRDCTSLCKTASLKDDGNICVIDLCAFEWGPDSAILHVRANRFLHHMVRIMVGTLVEVGLGRRSPESIPEMLAARNRGRAGAMAPPEGLFLEKVYYPDIPCEGENA